MDRFTKLEKNVRQKGEDEKNLSVDNKNNISEIVILPYFKDEGYFLLRYGKFPALKKGESDQYQLTCIKGEYDEESTDIQNLKRILLNETGIVLSSVYTPEINNVFYKDNDGDKSKYYVCLLELNFNDYKQSSVKSTNENRVVKVSLGDIDDIKYQDLITNYMILKLKYDNNIH